MELNYFVSLTSDLDEFDILVSLKPSANFTHLLKKPLSAFLCFNYDEEKHSVSFNYRSECFPSRNEDLDAYNRTLCHLISIFFNCILSVPASNFKLKSSLGLFWFTPEMLKIMNEFLENSK